MLTFMQGLARQEGFGVRNARPTRNNNPGDLEYEPWQRLWGARLEIVPTGETAVFAQFLDVAEGWAAMRFLLNRDYIGMTVTAALAKWAPESDGNNLMVYETNVCAWTGMQPTTILTRENIG